jgi:hypothetical protein
VARKRKFVPNSEGETMARLQLNFALFVVYVQNPTVTPFVPNPT